MTFQSTRFYGLIIGLALLSYIVAQVMEPEETRITVKKENPMDYYSIGYQKKEMDETGRVKNLLLADKMTHYAGDGTTHLDKPRMTLYSQKKGVPPWIIQSEQGILQADGENLLLTGKVNIQRQATDSVIGLTIHTSELSVHLPSSFAKTSQWAEILRASDRTIGVGMRLNYQNPVKITLLSKVKGRYEMH